MNKISGILHKNNINGNYFADPNNRAVYLTGSHTWTNMQERGVTLTPFSYQDFLNTLECYHHNFFRLWYWENAKWCGWQWGDYFFDPMPYERTGKENALDGKPKYDLTRYNAVYFERLKERISMAQEKGIYVAIMFFNGWSIERKGFDLVVRPCNAWPGNPYHPDNNINSLNIDLNHNGEGEELHTLLVDEKVTQIQKKYVKKVIDETCQFHNVLYEISNEDNYSEENTKWQYEMIQFVKTYEKETYGINHPVGMTSQIRTAYDNSSLEQSSADWISPLNSQWEDYLTNPPMGKGNQVIIADTDHIAPEMPEGNCLWVWKCFLRGLNPIFMDDWNFTDDWKNQTRIAMGQTKCLSDDLDMNYMLPDRRHSSKYCLCDGVDVILCLQETDGDLSLDGLAGEYTSEWLSILSGERICCSNVCANHDSIELHKPFYGAGVILLRKLNKGV